MLQGVPNDTRIVNSKSGTSVGQANGGATAFFLGWWFVYPGTYLWTILLYDQSHILSLRTYVWGESGEPGNMSFPQCVRRSGNPDPWGGFRDNFAGSKPTSELTIPFEPKDL
eukprot:404224_1